MFDLRFSRHSIPVMKYPGHVNSHTQRLVSSYRSSSGAYSDDDFGRALHWTSIMISSLQLARTAEYVGGQLIQENPCSHGRRQMNGVQSRIIHSWLPSQTRLERCRSPPRVWAFVFGLRARTAFTNIIWDRGSNRLLFIFSNHHLRALMVTRCVKCYPSLSINTTVLLE